MITSRFDPKDPSSKAAALSDIDQRLRRSIQLLWVLLPPDRRNCQRVEFEFIRLLKRALENFESDMQHFPRERGNDKA